MGRLVKGEGRIVAESVLSAMEQARSIVARAREQAAELRAGAEQDAARLRQEAREAGRAQAVAEAASMMMAARADAELVRRQARDMALPLAARMAARIAGRAIELDPAFAVDVAEQALAECRAREGRVVLRVHPGDLATLELQRPRLLACLGVPVELVMVADDHIALRGCVVETPSGQVDAQLSTQLDALERALLENA